MKDLFLSRYIDGKTQITPVVTPVVFKFAFFNVICIDHFIKIHLWYSPFCSHWCLKNKTLIRLKKEALG